MVAKARLRGIDSVIPAKYRGVSFDRPPVTQISDLVVRPVRNFCDAIDENLDNGKGLWLFGGSGTGKTTLAMLVSRTALDAGRSVAVYSLPKLLTRIRRTYDDAPGEQSYAELFERLSMVDLLHLDDLGTESRTEWVLEQLYSLINERYEARRSLVVTTNYEEEDLRKTVGDRIVSRLAEMCYPLPLFEEDKRVQRPDDFAAPMSRASTLGPLDH
jgi:DNA replication protein DnaC